MCEPCRPPTMRAAHPDRTESRPAAWRLRLLARCRLALGRRASAEAALDELLDHHPGDGRARASRAHLRALRGARTAAIADLRAIATPRAADAFNLAYLLDAEGRDAEAEAAFRQALALDAALDRAWYGLGLLLARGARFAEAAAAFERHTTLQPLNPCGWYRLGHVHAQCGDAAALRGVIERLRGFEPRVAAQLERETA